MPKKLHNKLAVQAAKLGLKGKKADAYVYGTLEKAKKKRATRTLLPGGR